LGKRKLEVRGLDIAGNSGMTEKFPRVTAAETFRALEKAGFFLSRQSGSYKIYKNQKGRGRFTLTLILSHQGRGRRQESTFSRDENWHWL